MNWNVDAAIFDMDGTLLDTMRYWRYTTLEFLLAHGLPVRDEDLLRMHDTSSRRFLLDYAAREGLDFGSEREMIAELEGYMNRHYLYDAKLKPGVPELLDRLIGHGFRLCVATGSPREYARNGLGRLGVLDRFEFVTDNYEEPVTKAEPAYFDLVAKRLGTAPERCVVFEDALYAMESAKAAGCQVVAIEDSTARRQREDIQKVADRYVRRWSELWDEI